LSPSHSNDTTLHDTTRLFWYKVDIRFVKHDANTSFLVFAISYCSRHASFTSRIFPVTYFPFTYHFNHASLPSHILPVTYFIRRLFSRHDSFQSPSFLSRVFSVTYFPVIYNFNQASFSSRIFLVTYFPVTFHFYRHVYFSPSVIPDTYTSGYIFPPRIFLATYKQFPITYISRHVSLL
jgi:hypothetical protein